MADVVMPRLSDTMEEGTVLRWLKGDGDEVRRGEELVEIETDKATMTYESDQEGVLQIVAGEGDTLPVGELIARIGEDGGSGQATAAQGSDSTPGFSTPAPSTPAPTGGAETPADAGSAVSSAEARGAAPSADADSDDRGKRVKASPLAKRMAREDGVDLTTVTGTGPGGRIVKADVLAAENAEPTPVPTPGGAPGPTPAGTPTPTPATTAGTAKGETTTMELSRTQQTIARRMAESKATIPDFTLQMDVDMQECVALRTELKRLAHPAAGKPEDEPQAAPTYNDMIVKACALALREHPRANGSYRDARLQLYSRVNVGVAVAADGALVVPTVFDADVKSVGEIARETRTLAERVRAGTITPPELGGGTFTVSNLGMYGVRSFTAIVNPPQAAILSVGALAQRAVVRDGEIVARHTITLTLACDHRILYGADAAEFLGRIRELLEHPAALTL
jgi:pyruvate dehydrogenase E2 component (dihydrolipoamide acetyltransferase)